MSVRGFVQAEPTAPTTVSQPSLSLHLHVHDLLASTHRLWVRGRLSGLPVAVNTAAASWWHRRRTAETPLLALLETQVGGKTLRAETALSPFGNFDTVFEAELAPARRGWRVARNSVTCLDQTAEACALALAPRADAVGVVVVVLPRSHTLVSNSVALLDGVCSSRLIRAALDRLHRERWAIHYLACVPPGDNRQAELALAANSLGWPSGPFVLVPAEPDGADAALRHALDRLRWLFAGSLDVLMVNLDPAARPLLAEMEAQEDRAQVRTLVLPIADGPASDRDSGGSSRPIRSGRVTRYPIVFCHGMLACSMMRMQLTKDFNYFSVLRKFLHERGFRALFPLVTPTGGVVERARQLKQQIEAWTDEPVNVIAHSMGGLDARHLITHLGMADRVQSLTTLSTPHRGSPIADWFLANYRQRVPLLLALEALGVNVDGFRDCQPAVCRDFNARTPDAPRVRYFSYAGDVPLIRVTPMLRRSWDMLTALEGPNDGLVSVRSACWGEYLGAIPADHFAQTPDGLFVHPGEHFDSLGFIMHLIEGLALRGF